MSIVSSLVVVLLCFSFHACNARAFGVIVDKEQAEEIEQHSTSQKNGIISDPDRVSSQPDHTKFPVTNSSQSAKDESINKETKGIIESNDVKDIPTKNNHVRVSDTTTQVEPRESVSWKVPHKERRDPVPGFNLDYLPPRTHPPVHN